MSVIDSAHTLEYEHRLRQRRVAPFWRWHVRGEKTRQTLLDASAREILAHGYSGASLTLIGARLGLTKGALAHHFPTKDHLAVALLDALRTSLSHEATRARQVYPDQGLHALVHLLLALGVRVGADPQVAAGLALVTDRSAPPYDVADLVEDWRLSLAGLIEVAQDSHQLDTTVSVDAVAEHLVVICTGIAALRDRAYRADGERLSSIRLALTLLGGRDVDDVVDTVVRGLVAADVPPPAGIPRRPDGP